MNPDQITGAMLCGAVLQNLRDDSGREVWRLCSAGKFRLLKFADVRQLLRERRIVQSGRAGRARSYRLAVNGS